MAEQEQRTPQRRICPAQPRVLAGAVEEEGSLLDVLNSYIKDALTSVESHVALQPRYALAPMPTRP